MKRIFELIDKKRNRKIIVYLNYFILAIYKPISVWNEFVGLVPWLICCLVLMPIIGGCFMAEGKDEQ